MFNDISSIMDVAGQGEILVDDQQVNFEDKQIVKETCMESIPLSVLIIHDLVDEIIKEDEAKNVLAKQRALKLAI